jgi:SAM-dependent methyltransferase
MRSRQPGSAQGDDDHRRRRALPQELTVRPRDGSVSRGKESTLAIEYSFVVDAPGQFGYQAYLLSHSLIELGAVEPRDIKANLVSGTHPSVERALRDLGVRTSWVEPFGHPYCNRLQQLPGLAGSTAERVVLLDTDMFLTRRLDPPSDHAILGKMVDAPHPPLEILRLIFEQAGLPAEPAESDVLVDASVRANFNAGLYVVPRAMLTELSEAWPRWARWSLERISLFDRWHNNVDQVAFALAVAELGLPVSTLPREYNVPTHLGPVTVFDAPILLHYHRHVTDQLLLKPTGTAMVDVAVDLANAAIVRWRRDELCNPLFWSARYALHPELGSGVGSRGKALDAKRQVIGRLISMLKARSVIDIGGGDGATLERLANGIEHHVTDVAAGAEREYLRRNPDASFAWSDIVAGPATEADLAIGLDVLIHLNDADAYRAAVRNMLESGRMATLVSGFDAAPSYLGSLTHYHEPLLETIQRDTQTVAFPALAYGEQVAYVVQRGSTGHARDAGVETLRRAVLISAHPMTLLECVVVARRELGFFPDHLPRTIEYPWILETIRSTGRTQLRILDVGAGVNVLPLLLTDDGHRVTTVDSHSIVRTEPDRPTWTEWGYLDYAILRSTVTSVHRPYEDLVAGVPYDVIYSVSVIEHLPARIRRAWLAHMASQLSPGGRLLLTIDLRPMSRDLWGHSEGREVEPGQDHGTVDAVLAELQDAGFAVDDIQIRKWLPGCRVGLALINAERLRGPSATPGSPPSSERVPTVQRGRHTQRVRVRKWLCLGRERAKQRLSWLLRPNPLFDRGWYLATYPDVGGSRLGPYVHFRRHGVREGRDPNPFFDTDWYLATYPDVQKRHMNPLDHYLRFGGREGRNPGPRFDSAWYLRENPDVQASGMNPLLHFIKHGRAEGRLPAPGALADPNVRRTQR